MQHQELDTLMSFPGKQTCILSQATILGLSTHRVPETWHDHIGAGGCVHASYMHAENAVIGDGCRAAKPESCPVHKARDETICYFLNPRLYCFDIANMKDLSSNSLSFAQFMLCSSC